MPVFTVVIPLYNKAGYIKNTLATVYAQTFQDFEVIVVNDGSTDGSGRIFENHSYARLTYLKTDNAGAAAARNTAISKAQGQLIAFLDADDEWMPSHLEKLLGLHVQYPQAGMLALRYYIKNPGSAVLEKPVLNGIPDDFTGIVPDFFAASITNRLAVSISIAVPRGVFAATGLFNESYTNSEDTDMWVRIGLHYPVALGSSYTSVYNFHIPQSLSKIRLTEQKIMDFSAYAGDEQNNPGLNAFLNMYRLEYALKYRTAGAIIQSRELLKQVPPAKISLKKKVLFSLPPFMLRLMLWLKKWLYKRGIRLRS